MLARIAQKLLDSVSQPFKIEEHDIYVTSSIGISVYPADGRDPQTLMKHADVAMYKAKRAGGSGWAMWQVEDGSTVAQD